MDTKKKQIQSRKTEAVVRSDSSSRGDVERRRFPAIAEERAGAEHLLALSSKAEGPLRQIRLCRLAGRRAEEEEKGKEEGFFLFLFFLFLFPKTIAYSQFLFRFSSSLRYSFSYIRSFSSFSLFFRCAIASGTKHFLYSFLLFLFYLFFFALSLYFLLQVKVMKMSDFLSFAQQEHFLQGSLTKQSIQSLFARVQDEMGDAAAGESEDAFQKRL